MEDVSDSAVDDDGSIDEEASDEDDVHDGMPVQGSTIGDVDPESDTPIDIQEQTQAPTHSHQQQHPETEAETESETGSETQTHVSPKKELPPLYYSSQHVKSPDPNIVAKTDTRTRPL
jgi:hypothetical protein